MLYVLGYIGLLLCIGFLGGGFMAFAAKPTITEEQYRDIRANMKQRG